MIVPLTDTSIKEKQKEEEEEEEVKYNLDMSLPPESIFNIAITFLRARPMQYPFKKPTINFEVSVK
ncbi:hypothetical protein V1477_002835 [Vespula maculifrons]|uniref:Uncharacterized protein n=1 Tax=Vespula maculifrons TaxID=7453 RepID=A0ABD2CUS6_VESMC